MWTFRIKVLTPSSGQKTVSFFHNMATTYKVRFRNLKQQTKITKVIILNHFFQNIKIILQ